VRALAGTPRSPVSVAWAKAWCYRRALSCSTGRGCRFVRGCPILSGDVPAQIRAVDAREEPPPSMDARSLLPNPRATATRVYRSPRRPRRTLPETSQRARQSLSSPGRRGHHPCATTTALRTEAPPSSPPSSAAPPSDLALTRADISGQNDASTVCAWSVWLWRGVSRRGVASTATRTRSGRGRRARES